MLREYSYNRNLHLYEPGSYSWLAIYVTYLRIAIGIHIHKIANISWLYSGSYEGRIRNGEGSHTVHSYS